MDTDVAMAEGLAKEGGLNHEGTRMGTHDGRACAQVEIRRPAGNFR